MGLLLISFIGTAIFVFSINFFLFRKSGNPMYKFMYWVISFISTPIVYAGVIYLWYLSNASFEKKEFDKNIWANDIHSRYVYVEDLIDSQILIGLDSAEVSAILGLADNYDDSTITYYTGYSPEIFLNSVPDWLELELENGKVSNLIHIK